MVYVCLAVVFQFSLVLLLLSTVIFHSFLAQEVLKTLAVNFPQHNAPSSPSAAAPPPLSRPHVPLTTIPGTPDTLTSVQLLPARYRRRPLTVDEMDYIQVRGDADSITTCVLSRYTQLF